MGWLNALFTKLWPNIDAAVQKIVHEQVVPQVNESLPSMLRGRFKVSKLTLGSTPPQLGPITYHELPGGAKLKVGIRFDSSVDISLDLGASAGVRSVKFNGSIVLRLGPFMNEVPVVGGAVLYFLDRPRLELDFTGLGNIADAPGLAGIVRNTIDDIIAGAVVLPNLISVPLGTEEQGIDHAILKKPVPVGVMRVSIMQATNLLGKDLRLLGSATSDPYVRVRLSGDEWRSSTVQATCNPVWREDDYHDFFVYDVEQHFSFEVYDADRFSSDDLIGISRSIAVTEARGIEEALLPLVPGLEPQKPGVAVGSAHCGILKLGFSWFELLPGPAGPEGSVVAVKIKHLKLAASVATDISIVVELGGVKRSTPLIKAEHQSSAKTVDRTTCDIVKRCYSSGIDRATISKIVDLDASCVDELLGAGEHTSSDKAGLAEPKLVQVDTVIYIPQVHVESDSSQLCILMAVDKKGNVLGTAPVDVGTVVRGAATLEVADVLLKRLPDGVASGIEVCIDATVHGLRRHTVGPQEFDIGSAGKTVSEGGSPWR